MSQLQEIPLGSDGLAYVESCLAQGSGLCAKIRELSLLSSGETFALARTGTSTDRVRRFDVGGLLSRLEVNMWLVSHIGSLFVKAENGILVFQDIWAKPDDPPVINSSVDKFFDDSNVYYFLSMPDPDTFNIDRILRQVQSYLMVAVFSDCPVSRDVLGSHHRSRGGLVENLARNTQEIFVSAYDQDGLVTWRKSA